MVSVLAADALARFKGKCDSIKLRVGGLPAHPKLPLNYKIVFSPTGLINEYKEPATIIENHKIKEIPSMKFLEELHFPEPYGALEAFSTSGGTSTLPITLKDVVKNLDYKTIRYKGHCAIINMLFDIGFADEDPLYVKGHKTTPRDALEALLARQLTDDDTDLVLLRVLASKGDKSISYTIIDEQKGQFTAMQRTTAFSASIIAQMVSRGVIKEKGALYQEKSIPTKLYIEELGKRDIKVIIEEK